MVPLPGREEELPTAPGAVHEDCTPAGLGAAAGMWRKPCAGGRERAPCAGGTIPALRAIAALGPRPNSTSPSNRPTPPDHGPGPPQEPISAVDALVDPRPARADGSPGAAAPGRIHRRSRLRD